MPAFKTFQKKVWGLQVLYEIFFYRADALPVIESPVSKQYFHINQHTNSVFFTINS